MSSGGSQKQQVTRYRMSMHIGVATSLDAIVGVYVDDKVAWEGTSSDAEIIDINLPNLFGGEQQQGGLVGRMYHLPGKPDQTMPEELAARLGKVSATCPGFRLKSTLFFVGQAASTGFQWTMNNVVLAQSLKVKGRRAPKGLDPAKAMIGPDANGAHIIYEVMTNTSWGMGAPPQSFNLQTFEDAATTLFNEGFGLSFLWTTPTEHENIVNEVLAHIQGVLFVNPKNGLFELKLIRDDYDITKLRTINPENAKLSSFKRKLWGETVNEVAVTWTNPVNEQEETVVAQDLANIQNQGGQVVHADSNYYMVRNVELAKKLAIRDVRNSSAPLASANAILDRRAWDLTPGEVVLLDWPEEGIEGLVFRCMPVNYGRPGDSALKVALVEDVFSLEKPPIGATAGTSWSNPGTPPEPIHAAQIITLPAYFVASTDLQTSAVDLDYPEVLAAVLAYTPQKDVRSYVLEAASTSSTGVVGYTAAGNKAIVERTTLPGPMAAGLTGFIQTLTVANPDRGPQVGGFVFIGQGHDTEIEIAQVISRADDGSSFQLARGVLDTIPRAWSAGTAVWFVNPGLYITDELTLRSDGEVVDYKALPRTSRGVLGIADADPFEQTLTGRPHYPLRPANVKVNGTAFGVLDGSSADTFTVTWATRNRLLEDGQVYRWEQGPIPPEYKQGTVLTVYANGAKVFEQPNIWTETSWALPKAWFARYGQIDIVVSARRDDFNSLQAHTITVTGLPNNPAAPPPPAAVDTGPPPSPAAAPGEGAFVLSGSEFTQDPVDGHVTGQVPAIKVTGKRDTPDAIGLVVRYKLPTSNDWHYFKEIALGEEAIAVSETAVAPQTKYDGQVAYAMSNNVLSQWRDLGEVTTGLLIANQVGHLTAEDIDAKFAAFDAKVKAVEDTVKGIDTDLDAATKAANDAAQGARDARDAALADAAAALKAAQDATALANQAVSDALAKIASFGFTQDEDFDETAQAIIQRSLETATQQAYFDALSRLDGQKVKEVVVQHKIEQDDLYDSFYAVAVRNGDAQSTLIRDDKVKTGVDAQGNPFTLAQSISSINSTIGQNYSDITTNYLTKVDYNSATAVQQTLLDSRFNNNNANIALTYLTKADNASAMAVYDVGIRAAYGQAISNATQNMVTTSSLASTLASFQTTLNVARDQAIANATQNLVTVSGLTDTLAAFQTTLNVQRDQAIANATQGMVTTSNATQTLAAFTTNLNVARDQAISNATQGMVTSSNAAVTLAGFATTLNTQRDQAISNATSGLVTTSGLNNAIANYNTQLSSSYAANPIDAKIGANNTNVLVPYVANATQNLTTLADVNGAISNYDTNISSAYGGLKATAQFAATTAVNTAGKIESRAMMQVQALGPGGLLVMTGMEVIAAAGANTTSDIRFWCDNFFITSPNQIEGRPFFYDATTGTLGLHNLLVDAAVIKDATIGTLKLADGSVSSSSSFAGGFQDITNAPTLVSGTKQSNGGRMRVSININVQQRNSKDCTVQVKVYRDGGLLKVWRFFARNNIDDVRSLFFSDNGIYIGYPNYFVTVQSLGINDASFNSVSASAEMELENIAK